MKRLIVCAFFVLAFAKWAVAANLDLFGDEAFYWQCGQRPALTYIDHPPTTALLVRLGSELLGDSPLGVRSLFLVLGMVFPWLIYHLAHPLVGERDAWWAAGAALIIPAVAHLGLLAIPDVPMLVLTALFLLIFERATRGEATAWWLSGLVGGLGLLTHYRFVLAPAAAFIYLTATRSGRRHWQHRGPWRLLPGLLLGLVPAVVYNTMHRFEPVRYYLAGRHGGQFDLENLLEGLAQQMLLVTPLLFAALVHTFAIVVQRARCGDDRAALSAIFAGTHLGLFFLASPFEDSGLSTAHWPAPGYLALLPFLPATLRAWARPATAWRRGLATLAPVSGALLLSISLAGLAAWIQVGSLREPFTGWSEVADRAGVYLADLPAAPNGRAVVIGDHYKLGAQLDLALHGSADVYSLDHRKNHAHGRAPQFALWQRGEVDLRQRRGQALAVVELTQIRRGEQDAWIHHVASFFVTFETLGDLRIESPGKRKKTKHFRFYRGTLADPAETRQGAS